MALGYRSIFTIPGDQNKTEELVMEQFNEWLKKDPPRNPRNLNRDLYGLNAVTVFNPTSELIYFDHKTQDKSRSVRLRLIENKEIEGRWISTLTMHFPGKNKNETIIMYEGDSPVEGDAYGNPRAKWVGPPRLVRRIVALDICHDGINESIALNERPRVIGLDECEWLYEAVLDHERNWSIIVASSKVGENAASKIDLLDKLTHDSVGVASTFILTPDASAEFNRLVGKDHGVWSDNIRVYLPDVDLAVPLNAKNHPVIKMANIDLRDPRRTVFYIGLVTRRALTEKPLRSLKRELAKIEQSLNDREYEVLLTGQKIVEHPKVVTTSTQANELPQKLSEDLRAFDQLRTALGVEEFTLEVINETAVKVSSHDLLAGRLSAANAALQDSEVQVYLLRDQLDTEILDHSESYEENRRLANQVKFLRNELSKVGLAEKAWQEVPEDEKTFYPENFQVLLESISKLPFIEFTGDPDITRDLDATEFGVRSGNAWDELCGLNDYCQAKRDGKVNGGVMEYITNLPQGYRPITKKNYRAKESESVERDGRMSNLRLFPVPTRVDPSGRLPMFAHFNIAKRIHMHFYEDFTRSGKIYVGRIGPHLEVASSN
jgi:hypothetical protein